MSALLSAEIDLTVPTGPIGWYAHHQGVGHVQRALAVAAHLPDVTIFSSLATPGVRHLALDVDPPRSVACAAGEAALNLHHAPVGVDGIRNRMASLAMWVASQDPALFVVDVSVEVATFLRLLSVPTVVVRQHGRREDAAHRMGYANAQGLLAPFPEWLEDPATPDWVRARTTYTGGFSRFDGRRTDQVAARERLGIGRRERVVVVLTGADGRAAWPVGAAARATPAWRWVLVGDDATQGHATGADLEDVAVTGWLEDPFDWLCAADVVVTHAGHNAVMEVASADRPMVVVPVDRPHDEQRRKASVLRATGAATVRSSWPEARAWPDLLDEAADRTTGLQLCDGQGAARAAAHLVQLAERYGRQVQPA